MILNEAAAVLSDSLSSLAHSNLKILNSLQSERAVSSAGSYALAAVGLMRQPLPQALVCLCGPTGSTSRAFEPGRDRETPNNLLTPGFSKRARRIHPFTLLEALQNQVSAMLSLRFGIRGPVINLIEGAEQFPFILPHLELFLEEQQELLLVFAADRRNDEIATFHRLHYPNTAPIAGAIAFRIGRESSASQDQSASEASDAVATSNVFDPLLSPAFKLFEKWATSGPFRLTTPSRAAIF